jgi:hypothetical protein
MSGFGEWRSDGWQERLVSRTRELFEETAERHNLKIEFDDGPGDVGCTYPKQPRLEFDLYLTLYGDEMHWSGEGWSLNVFPADQETTWDRLAATLDGIITGQARIVIYTPIGRSKPYWSVVQLNTKNGWVDISTAAGCALPPAYRTYIIQNGNGVQKSGRFGIAWGCLALLLVGSFAGVWAIG